MQNEQTKTTDNKYICLECKNEIELASDKECTLQLIEEEK